MSSLSRSNPNPWLPWEWSTTTKLVVGGSIGIVALWYYFWGQWSLFGIPKRIYRGVSYFVTDFCLFSNAPEGTYCWNLFIPNQTSSTIPLGGDGFSTGFEADAAAHVAIDGYLNSHNNQLPWPTQ